MFAIVDITQAIKTSWGPAQSHKIVQHRGLRTNTSQPSPPSTIQGNISGMTFVVGSKKDVLALHLGFCI
ncbi:hypothetical protein J1614_008059 [Plenodomus biglobosus]|nr:hypothetical protein J1614_008059 [Plenodomus biglobosus]